MSNPENLKLMTESAEFPHFITGDMNFIVCADFPQNVYRTLSTLSGVHFDYKKGVGISNYVRLMDHTRVKYRKPEICHGER